jgi:spermidine/putrescine transport system ATP-binding protein
MSDVIVVMLDGLIQQQGSPAELYERPVNRFVSNFIGVSNPIPGTVLAFDAGTRRARVESKSGLQLTGTVTDPDASPAAGDAVTVVVRPERLRVEPAADAPAADGWTSIGGRINQGTYLGDQTEYRIATGQAGELIVRRQNTAGNAETAGVGPGDSVIVRWQDDANLVLMA